MRGTSVKAVSVEWDEGDPANGLRRIDGHRAENWTTGDNVVFSAIPLHSKRTGEALLATAKRCART